MDIRKLIAFLLNKASAAKIITGCGMVVLALEPMTWLFRSWFDPALDSTGGWVFLLCAGLFLWSLRSPITPSGENSDAKPILILASTAIIRSLGQLFAINVIGAVALVFDVYAIALMMRVNARRNALSPGWLALLFAFSLPLERILQRLIGFGLQHLSANGTCLMLEGFFTEVKCAGIRILLDGRDVLVDLPCSGVKSLTLLGILYVAFMCIIKPSIRKSLFIGILTFISALIANTIRIVCLSIFMVYPEKIRGINVMAQPWHDIIGLICLTFAALPLVLICSRRQSEPLKNPKKEESLISDTQQNTKIKTLLAAGFLSLSLAIVSLPRSPLDVSHSESPLSLPQFLNGYYGQTIALTRQERAYFTQYGGSALKMRYGDNSSVLLIRTDSPLRHLHSPDECLRGLGFNVTYEGIHYQPIPTAIYIATGPDGAQWRVSVTFYSEFRRFSTNVSEVVWMWLQQPHSTWYALQRITPLNTPNSDAQLFDKNLFSALEINPPTSQEKNHDTNF
ncbi:MAG: exosortase T [Methylococcaceae bacterium]|nr:exosortase T [Methylococcaceae bacterium]